MTGGCHNNPLIFWADGLWFSAHIWRMTSALTLSTGKRSASFHDVRHAGEQWLAPILGPPRLVAILRVGVAPPSMSILRQQLVARLGEPG